MSVTREPPVRAGAKAVQWKRKSIQSAQHTPHGTPTPASASAARDSTSSLESLSVGEQLRQWVRNHDWHRLDILTNRLQLYRAFGRLICAAVGGLVTEGRSKLAMQVKTDFAVLLDLVEDYDHLCARRCVDEDDLVVCEHIQERIYKAVDDLASLLDHREQDGKDVHKDVKPQSGEVLNPSSRANEQWVTFAQAADLLAVGKGTVSKWAKLGRFIDNRLTGQARRLSKASVLMVRQEIDDATLQNDAHDLRLDARRIGT